MIPPLRRIGQVGLLAASWTGAAALGARLCVTSDSRAIGGGLLALAGGAGLFALDALVVDFDPFGDSVTHGSRAGKMAALTFDDGPSRDTPLVLNALARAQVRATFFVVGAQAQARPWLIRAISRHGHAIGLHTYSHRALALASPRTIAREIDDGRAALRACGVEPAPLFRAPRGWKGPLLRRALAERGLRLVAWTRGAWDTEPRTAAQIASAASENPRAGDILLLHDGTTAARSPRRVATAEAIAEIVARYRAKGLAFITLPELLSLIPSPFFGGGLAWGDRDREQVRVPPP